MEMGRMERRQLSYCATNTKDLRQLLHFITFARHYIPPEAPAAPAAARAAASCWLREEVVAAMRFFFMSQPAAGEGKGTKPPKGKRRGVWRLLYVHEACGCLCVCVCV